MTMQEIRSKLPVTESGYIVLRRSAWGSMYVVSAEELASIFVNVPLEYEAMKAHDASNNLGYADAIEQWHREGRI